MAYKSFASIALLLCLNLVFVSMASAACPNLDVCVSALNDLVHLNLPTSRHVAPCCPLLGNLVGLDAAACLCASVKVNVLGLVKLNLDSVALNLLLNQCGKHSPSEYKCPH